MDKLDDLSDRLEVAIAVAQLRQAYRLLNKGLVLNQKELANGLLSPAIQRLEKVFDL